MELAYTIKKMVLSLEDALGEEFSFHIVEEILNYATLIGEFDYSLTFCLCEVNSEVIHKQTGARGNVLSLLPNQSQALVLFKKPIRAAIPVSAYDLILAKYFDEYGLKLSREPKPEDLEENIKNSTELSVNPQLTIPSRTL
jgi:hypothetical protein